MSMLARPCPSCRRPRCPGHRAWGARCRRWAPFPRRRRTRFAAASAPSLAHPAGASWAPASLLAGVSVEASLTPVPVLLAGASLAPASGAFASTSTCPPPPPAWPPTAIRAAGTAVPFRRARVECRRYAAVRERELPVVANVDRLGAHLLALIVADHAQLIAAAGSLCCAAHSCRQRRSRPHTGRSGQSEFIVQLSCPRTLRRPASGMLICASRLAGAAGDKRTARRSGSPRSRGTIVTFVECARQRAFAIAVEVAGPARHRRLAVRTAERRGEEGSDGESACSPCGFHGFTLAHGT